MTRSSVPVYGATEGMIALTDIVWCITCKTYLQVRQTMFITSKVMGLLRSNKRMQAPRKRVDVDMSPLLQQRRLNGSGSAS